MPEIRDKQANIAAERSWAASDVDIRPAEDEADCTKHDQVVAPLVQHASLVRHNGPFSLATLWSNIHWVRGQFSSVSRRVALAETPDSATVELLQGYSTHLYCQSEGGRTSDDLQKGIRGHSRNVARYIDHRRLSVPLIADTNTPINVIFHYDSEVFTSDGLAHYILDAQQTGYAACTVARWLTSLRWAVEFLSKPLAREIVHLTAIETFIDSCKSYSRKLLVIATSIRAHKLELEQTAPEAIGKDGCRALPSSAEIPAVYGVVNSKKKAVIQQCHDIRSTVSSRTYTQLVQDVEHVCEWLSRNCRTELHHMTVESAIVMFGSPDRSWLSFTAKKTKKDRMSIQDQAYCRFRRTY